MTTLETSNEFRTALIAKDFRVAGVDSADGVTFTDFDGLTKEGNEVRITIERNMATDYMAVTRNDFNRNGVLNSTHTVELPTVNHATKDKAMELIAR